MPGFYRKKRRKVGPSKNDEKVLRGRQAEAETRAAGTLSSRFPGARALSVRLSIVSPQGVVLDEREVSLGADDPFQIDIDCPGRCGSGNFDFSDFVSEALERREESGQVEASCGEPLYGGGPDLCGCVARCEFSAEFAAS
ncbi:MAG: hypothetical protein KGM24_00690 [Elusimicrobia bacterium]|nr:hypothetical protein [Elusimicrobiota bacterium]